MLNRLPVAFSLRTSLRIVTIRNFSRLVKKSRKSLTPPALTSTTTDQSNLDDTDNNEVDVVIDVVSKDGQNDLQISKSTLPRSRRRSVKHSPLSFKTSETSNVFMKSSLNHFQLPDDASDSKVLSALVSARPDKQFNNSLDLIDRDLEDKIVAAADGDVELALGIRDATNQRKVRVAMERIKTQKLRVFALKEVANEEAGFIKKAYESLIATGQTLDDSVVKFEPTTITNDGDAGNAIQQLVSNLRIASRDGLSSSLYHPSQGLGSSIKLSTIDALNAQNALLRSAEALAIASGSDFIGPGDRGVMIDAAQSIGVDIEALLVEQRQSSQRKEKVTKRGKTFKSSIELSETDLPGLFEGDTLDNDDSDFTEDDMDFGNSRNEEIPKTLSEKLESDPLFDGLALPDYLVTRRGESLPEQRGQTDDFFNDDAIPNEIQERQAQLRKIRARSEISHAKRLLIKALSATMRAENGSTAIGVLNVTDDLSIKTISDNQLSKHEESTTSLSSLTTFSKDEGFDKVNSATNREEKIQEAQELMVSLGFPVRDAQGRAIIPLKEDESRVIAEKKAYSRLTQRPTSQQVDAYAALRKSQAEEALAAGDEEAIVAKLLENVENEDLDSEADLTSLSNGKIEGNSLSPRSSSDLSISSLTKPKPQKTRLSLVPEGYRNWNEVAVEAARPENAKRASKARAKLSAQQQQVLDGTIKAPKDNTLLKTDAQGQTSESSTTPRQVRVASNLLGSLQNELSAMASESTTSSIPNPHVELVEVTVTPDLRKAFVRWRIPDDKSDSTATLTEKSTSTSNGDFDMSLSSKDTKHISFSELLHTPAPPSHLLRNDQHGSRKKLAKEVQPAYFMDDPSSSSARWLLNSHLRKEISRKESFARAHRRPKKQDIYLLHRQVTDGDSSITKSQAVADAATFLERRAGALRRAVATRLKLRFTPQLEFHQFLGPLRFKG